MRPFLPIVLASACALSACGQPETRQFEINVDDRFYTVTETRKGLALFGRGGGVERTVRVGSSDVPCPVLPCTAEIRAARGETADDFDAARLPPPGADLGTEE